MPLDANIRGPYLAYRQQRSQQTLAEGLAEYYAANRGRVTNPADMPPESAELFRSHDIGHVIFGLSTSLSDEAVADTRILFSTDVGFLRYSRYLTADEQTKAIFKEIGYGKVVLYTVLMGPRILRAILEAWCMKKRWPWVPPYAYQSRSLADLRGEFGIRVI